MSSSESAFVSARPLQRAVVLIGLMGVGKTAVGRRLARCLGVPFADSDEEIEKAAGRSIRDIFALEGEAAFRAAEERIIARLLAGPLCVLATGGGAFLSAATRALVQQKALSVWLKADLDLLIRRTAGRPHRPLLNQGDPRAVLSALIEARYPVYALADVVVEVLDLPRGETCARVVRAIEDRLGHPLSPSRLPST